MIAVTEELEKRRSHLSSATMSRIFSIVAEASRSIASCCRIRGEKTSAFGLSEPASGADPSMLQTTAMPDGDDFIINGTKMFPTFRRCCGLCATLRAPAGDERLARA